MYIANGFRIIEIAGGREIYSQSRSKAVRKPRTLVAGDESDKKKQKSPMRQGVWELRGRSGDGKKLRNARDFTETVFASEVCSVAHEHGHELALEPEDRSSPEDERPASPTGVPPAPGEVVIFDDIGESWRDDEPRMEDHTAPAFAADPESLERVAKVIGNLPIAVYEGSPRRYGPRQPDQNCTHPQLPSAQSLLASPSVYPPRPGFPQRVVCTPGDSEPPLPSDTANFNVSLHISDLTYQYLSYSHVTMKETTKELRSVNIA